MTLPTRIFLLQHVLALLQLAAGQRPSNTSICDYYTTAILKTNTPQNQLTFMTYILNTVIAGNYSKPNIAGISWPDLLVPGVLTPAVSLNESVNLLPYFNGGLASTHRTGGAVAIDFLDGGGVSALKDNRPANSQSSNQYVLMTHLYQFFGLLLGCTNLGQSQSSPYEGIASQFDVHRYMALDTAQLHYFIDQVFLSLRSFGSTVDDAQAVSNLLSSTFGERCAPDTTVVPSVGPVQQAICIADDCMPASNSDCSAYPAVVAPAIANSSLLQGLGQSTNSAISGSTSTNLPAATTGTSGSFATDSPASGSSSSPNASSVPSSSGGLSDGAKIGLGVGIGIGGLVILIALTAYFLGRRAGRNTKNTTSDYRQQDSVSKLHGPGVAVDHSEPGVAVDYDEK